MVNYCCIQGCNRNSRTHKNLNFFSLPKDKNRQKKWLQLAGREDLIERDLERLRRSLRVCSRHFNYNFKVKNRYLSHDALPSKKLPGSLASDESDIEPADHEGVICDNCSESVIGFRYKCVSCENYDLCQKCEMVGSHPQHYMLRIPKSIKFQTAENLLSKWQRFFNSEHVTPLNVNEMSSDDEPVTKYIKIRNYDSGIDLSEDVKRGIRTEIDRALKSVEAKKKSVETSGSNVILNNLNTVKTPELEFADVNEYNQSDVKVEDHSIAVPQDQPQPMFFMKLSGDLSDLMIELTPNKES